MKKEKYITQGSGDREFRLFRCQGVNKNSGCRTGEQCKSPVPEEGGFCKHHQQPKRCAACGNLISDHVDGAYPGLVSVAGFDQPVNCIWLASREDVQ
jgi:hypothetical protein